MAIKTALSLAALCAFASFGLAACAADADEPADDSASEVQDQELRKRSLDGDWGASSAMMTIAAGEGNITFGCGSADINAFKFSNASTFTAKGSYTQHTGVRPRPGMEPKAQPATFEGHLVGNKLTLEMKVGTNESTMTFTKNRQTNLKRCM